MKGIAVFLAVIAAAALTTAAGNAAWSSEKKYGPGVSDTEIKIGQTIAYSGPASSFGTIGHTISAYYRMINDRGGSMGAKSISSALTMATARRRPSNRPGGSWSRTRCWRSSGRSATRPTPRSSAT